jgi:AraC-like DNA-binding protein
MLRFEEAPPPEALRPFVHAVWTFAAADGAPPVHHVPPDGCVSVVLSPGGAVLVGPRRTDLAVPVHPGDRFRGVRMRPEAAGALIGLTPRAWVGRVAPLAEADAALAAPVAGLDADAALDRLLGALAARAATAPAPDPLVRQAVAAMDAAGGEGKVEALARALGVSARTLQRRFAAATGLAPKPFARIRRFRLAVATLLRDAPETWGRVAAEHGFADQAHLTREVAALTGVSPTAFEARTRRIAHVGVRP